VRRLPDRLPVLGPDGQIAGYVDAREHFGPPPGPPAPRQPERPGPTGATGSVRSIDESGAEHVEVVPTLIEPTE
jgi:hypothetical protein